MAWMEADVTAVLFFPPYLYPLLSQHSIRLFVNELVIGERKDWFIPDRCVLSRVLGNEDIAPLPPLSSFIPFLFSFSLFALPLSVFLSAHSLFLTILAW